MAELAPRDRLQPSLLDRLTDHAPGAWRDGQGDAEAILNVDQLRRAVIRDLGWLLNTTNHAADEDLSSVPEVAQSVVNYGIPDLTGHSLSQFTDREIESMLRESLLRFEPRLDPRTLKVTLTKPLAKQEFRNLSLLIEADLWAQPLPLHLYFKTEINLDTGHARLSEVR
jgi:type VI secretion system protein ImpF